jgi:hypothetical protein
MLEIKNNENDIRSYLSFYSYLINRCRKESKEYTDNIVYIIGFILSNITFLIIGFVIGFSFEMIPFIFFLSLFILPISAGFIYLFLDLYYFIFKKKTFIRQIEKKNFKKIFKKAIKNKITKTNIQSNIRKEVYFYLKKNENKNISFEKFLDFIENKYKMDY